MNRRTNTLLILAFTALGALLGYQFGMSLTESALRLPRPPLEGIGNLIAGIITVAATASVALVGGVVAGWDWYVPTRGDDLETGTMVACVSGLGNFLIWILVIHNAWSEWVLVGYGAWMLSPAVAVYLPKSLWARRRASVT